MLKLKLFSICALTVAMNSAWSEGVTELKSEKDKLSYAIGVSTGKNLKKQGTDIDMKILIQGMKSGLAGEKLLMPEKEIRNVMNNFATSLRQNDQVTRRQAMDVNKKKGDAFLAENKSKPGVVTLPSGVQYKIIKTGEGRKPAESDMVQVKYRGTLLDGTEFDDTGDNIVNLKASALIAGWKQALTLMPVGSRWKIYIPSQLAYGERGVGSDIGPNETLVFEVELIAIK